MTSRPIRNWRAWRAVCAAVFVPLIVTAQSRLSPRDSAILAAPFAETLSVNTTTMRLLAPAVFVEDLTRGTGTEVARGQVVMARAEVWRTDGSRVLSGTCQSVQFKVGSGMMINGVDTAVRGMQPGGTRLMVLGSERAYGTRGAAGEVLPGETLVVRLLLLDVSEQAFPNPNDCLRG